MELVSRRITIITQELPHKCFQSLLPKENPIMRLLSLGHYGIILVYTVNKWASI